MTARYPGGQQYPGGPTHLSTGIPGVTYTEAGGIGIYHCPPGQTNIVWNHLIQEWPDMVDWREDASGDTYVYQDQTSYDDEEDPDAIIREDTDADDEEDTDADDES